MDELWVPFPAARDVRSIADMSMIADSLKSRTSFSPEKESRLSSMDVHMSEKAFRESLVYLGLSPYYDGFIAEAFDSWAVLSAITEADL